MHRFQKPLILFLIILLQNSFLQISLSAESSVEIVKIIDHGPDSSKINFVIFGDGFTINEQDLFLDESKVLAENILHSKAYASHQTSFNFYAVKTISNQSGASNNVNELIDTYFHSTFNYAGIERLLFALDEWKTEDLIKDYIPMTDQSMILVNDEKYGGSGGTVPVTSRHPDASEILLHELGHSFAGLQDEYFAGPEFVYESINLTKNHTPDTVPWKSFIDKNGIGIYPVEGSNGWYRPHQNCKMRVLGSEFCDVCQDAHEKKIQQILSKKAPSIPTPTIAFTNTPTVTPTSKAPTNTPTHSPTKSPTYSPSATPLIDFPEDINGDQEVNTKDLVVLKQFILKKVSQLKSSRDFLRGDLNRDQEINSIDYVVLKQYITKNTRLTKGGPK
jgi:hypothetical protein